MSDLRNRITIADAGPESIDAVMEIMEQAFDRSYGEAWNRSQCLGIIGLPGVWLMIACLDGQAAGFALGRVVVDDAELMLIAVRPALRGAGIGRDLLDRAIATSRDRGGTRLHLEMRDGNDAVHLYRSRGFEPSGRRKAYYTGSLGQTYDAVTLTLDLAGSGLPSGTESL